MKSEIFWTEEKNEVDRGQALKRLFDGIWEDQREYREQMVTHFRMYRNLDNIGYGIAQDPRASLARKPLSLNVVRNMTNAVFSKITKQRVKLQVQTTGAPWEAKDRAEKIKQYSNGLGHKEKLWKKAPLSFLDMVVTGTGVAKTMPDKRKKQVLFDRVFTPHFVVDFAEGALGAPASFHEIHWIDKRVLLRRYQEKRDAILAKNPTAEDDEFFLFSESLSENRLMVLETLYLDPEDPEKSCRSVNLDGVELEFEERWGDYNPYSVMRWSGSNFGYYGMGLAEELKGIQIEINRLARKIQNAFGLLANPYVLADRAAAISRGSITDIPGSVILYNGKKPDVIAPQTVHAEVFAHLDRLYQRAFEIAGVSQLYAQGQRPSGEISGRAAIVMEEIESDRFAYIHRQWDDFQVDMLWKGIQAGKKIPGYRVPIYGENTFELMSFTEDIQLEDDDWVMHPAPVSFLGEEPAAQIQTAQSLAQSGFTDSPEEILYEYGSPDLAAFLRRKTAPKRLAEAMVYKILAEGKYTPPDPAMNLALSLEISQEVYNLARSSDRVPKARLRMLREFQLAVKSMLDLASGLGSTPTLGATASVGGPPPLPTAAPPLPPGPPAAGGAEPPM